MQQPQRRLSELTRTTAAANQHRDFWRDIATKAAPEKWQTRTAATVATTTTHDTLAPRGVGPVVNLAPQSVAAKLAAACVAVDFSGVVNVLVQKIVTQNNLVTHIGEGGVAQMVQLAFDPVLIGPLKKFLFGCPITADLRNHSLEAAIPIIEQSLSQIATTEIDGPLLDTAALTTARPAGLLHNVTAITATSGGGLAALAGDVGKLSGAMGAAKIPTEKWMLLMNPGDADRARTLSPWLAASDKIVDTNELSLGTIVGIAPKAIAMYMGTPQVDVSDSGPVIHMDSSAVDIVTSGTAATGGNVVDAFQCNLILYECRLSGSWGKLSEAAVQTISSISW